MIEKFLNRIAKTVKSIEELKEKDIVCCMNPHQSHEIRMYCVDKIPKKSFFPCVNFKNSHIGLVFSQGEIFRHYLYVPSPGESYLYGWSEDTYKEEDDDFKDMFFPLFLVTDEHYIKLGNLIKEIEIPSWSFLCQTTQGEQGIYDFVTSIKQNMQTSKDLYLEMKNKQNIL